MQRDALRVPENEDDGEDLPYGSVCSGHEDDCCLSFNGNNIGMDVDGMGGGYESFDCNHNDETNALIDCCVESDGISLVQDSGGGGGTTVEEHLY